MLLFLLVAAALGERAIEARPDGRTLRRGAARRVRAPAVRHRPFAGGGRVAVQPFEGPGTDPLRATVVRVVRNHGFHPVTGLPRYEGTGQYPGLARDHHLTAFVTAGLEERGSWQRITFLVWNGLSGSVLARWTASAPSAGLGRAVGKGFWAHLGPALSRATAPATPTLGPAAPMRIDASDDLDEPVAAK